MITPRFSCSQTKEVVIVSIYCPSIRAADVEIFIDETLFTIHVSPYFLRLNFSHPVLEDDASSAKYDPSSGYLTVTLTKETEGQKFQDLDLLAKLLAPRPSVRHPVIEVLSTETNTEDDQLTDSMRKFSLEHDEFLEAAEDDWHLPQTVPEPLPALQTSLKRRYGFLDMYSGYFTHVTHTENEINELGADAETCPSAERQERRLMHEEEKWDEEYYMGDFADDEIIQELTIWQHPHIRNIGTFEFTDDENMALLRLPLKEYLPTRAQTRNLHLTLVTLLFSYAYDARTTQHDPTSESAWTICSLTPAFSALDPPDFLLSSFPSFGGSSEVFTDEELRATLIPSYRRALSFPLYRSFKLAEACHKDVACLLLKGKRTVVRCLLEMKHILDHHEVYYVYSKIWLDDFCVWTQAHAGDEVLSVLGHRLESVFVHKSSIGWNLAELERATQCISDVESDSDDESAGENDSPALL